MNESGGPRIGVIGCGNIAHAHLDNLARLGIAQARAYADVRRASADECLDRYGGAYATDDPERLLGDRDIDAIIIASPDTFHAEQAILALAAEKHLFLEKPMAITVADALKVQRAAAASPGKFMLDLRFRWAHTVARAREFVPRPVMLFGQAVGDPEPSDHWRLDPAYSAGVVYDLGPHLFDLMYWLAGESEPVRVYSEGGALMRPGHQLVDSLVTTIRFANGTRATTVIGNAGTSGFTSKWLLEVFGGDRSATIYNHTKSLSLRRAGGELVEVELPDRRPPRDDVGRALETFLRAVIDGGTPPVGAVDGVRVTRMLAAAVESAATGHPIDLAPDSGSRT